MPSTFDRVAARAASLPLLKFALSVLAVPFYVLGLVAAVLFVVVRFMISAALVGFADLRAKAGYAPTSTEVTTDAE